MSSVCSSFGRAASGGALAPEPPRATGAGPESHGFCFPFSGVLFVSVVLFPLLFFTFFEIGLQLCCISDLSKTNMRERSDHKNSQMTDQKYGMKIRRDSGPTPVARGGSGDKAHLLAARPELVGVAEGVSPL